MAYGIFLDGVFMVDCLVRYMAPTLIISVLLLGEDRLL
jgi:hypothetical protein